MAPEVLEGDNAYACDKCVARARAVAAADREAEAAVELKRTASTSEAAAAVGVVEAAQQAAQQGVAQARGRAEAATSAKPTLPTGQPALTWVQASRPPQALTLHLKRFRWLGRKVLTICITLTSRTIRTS